MRLLNSVCKVIADKYKGVPVYIQDLPEGFSRPSFLVTEAVESSNLKNQFIYENDPTFQIVYHGRLNASDQAYAEGLYEVKSALKEIFLIPGAIKVITDLKKEKQRYAKVTGFNSNIRLEEKSVYTNVVLSFTDHFEKPDHYELMEDIDMEVRVR